MIPPVWECLMTNREEASPIQAARMIASRKHVSNLWLASD
jgi:hypothetical protein